MAEYRVVSSLEVIFEFSRFHGLEDGGVGAIEADLVVEVGGGEGEEEAGPVDQDGPSPGLEGDRLRDLVGPLKRRHIVPASNQSFALWVG